MPALFPVQDSFVRGEISPRLHARASLELYRGALSLCENFITLPHGGIRKRGGTYFCGEVKDSSKRVRLIPFVFSAEQAYALEFGHLYIRVYAYGARVGAVEVVSPWPEDELDNLQFVQSGDVMWLTHPNRPVYTLTRTDNTTWVLDVFSILDGPFSARNADDTVTAKVSAVSGTVTITASSAIFEASDVGRLFRIEMESYEGIIPWQPHAVQGASGYCRYEGRVYSVASFGATDRFGTTPPTHTVGTEADGPKEIDDTYAVTVGVDLTYLHSGFGVALINGFTSATEVTAQVITRFPEQVVHPDTSFIWSLGAFTDGAFPVSTALFEERLGLSTKLSVYASRTGDFDTFETGPAGDDGLEFLNAANEANDIVWLAGADGFLAIGTIGGVRALSGSGIDEALTPTSFKNRKSRTDGCARIRPVDAGSSFLYVTRSRTKIAELVINQSGRLSSDDIGQISEHIAKKGVVEIAFQADPDPILWFPLDNGEVGAYTHQPSQEVRGMHRHRISGALADDDWAIVEKGIVTPGQDGIDDVWLVVRRTINGQTRRYIEIMEAPFEYGDVEDAFCVDSGLTYEGSAVGTVSGLTHLEGEMVSALADGKVYSGLAVGSGQVSLPGGATASKWQVGLPFTSSADTLELDVGGRDGSLMGRRKKVGRVILNVFETDVSGLEIASLIGGRWMPVKIPSIAPPPDTATLFTGNIDVLVEDSWAGQCRVRIRHVKPTPCTIRAFTPVFDMEP